MTNILNLTLEELENQFLFSFHKFNKNHRIIYGFKKRDKVQVHYISLNQLKIQKKQTIKELFANSNYFTITIDGRIDVDYDKLFKILKESTIVDLTNLNKKQIRWVNRIYLNNNWFTSMIFKRELQFGMFLGSLLKIKLNLNKGSKIKNPYDHGETEMFMFTEQYSWGPMNYIYNPDNGKLVTETGRSINSLLYSGSMTKTLANYWQEHDIKLYNLYVKIKNPDLFLHPHDFVWKISNCIFTTKQIQKIFSLKVKKKKETNFLKKYDISLNKLHWAIKYGQLIKYYNIKLSLQKENMNKLKIIGNFIENMRSKSFFDSIGTYFYNHTSWRVKVNFNNLNLPYLRNVVNQIINLELDITNFDWLFPNNQFKYLIENLAKKYNQDSINITNDIDAAKNVIDATRKVKILDILLSKITPIRQKELEAKEIQTKNKVYFAMKKKMTKYTFAADNLVAILPQDLLSLDEETKQLHHCVWSYKDSIISGRSIILFIRHKDDINKSYYTMEIDPACNKIRQVHGLFNSNPDEFVEKFLVEYAKNKSFIDTLSVKESYGRLAAH